MVLENLWAKLPGNVWLAAVASRNLNGCALACEEEESVETPESSWCDVSGKWRSSLEEGVATKRGTLAIEFLPRGTRKGRSLTPEHHYAERPRYATGGSRLRVKEREQSQRLPPVRMT